jgi:hypothetical protein
MGLMDKAKEAAEKAKASAQHVAQQGQAKVASVQQGRSEGELYRALGEAVFAEQRRGGGHEAVTAALEALDAHFAAAPPAAAPPAGAPPAGAPPAAPAGSGPIPPASAPQPPPTGDFTLDDF